MRSGRRHAMPSCGFLINGAAGTGIRARCRRYAAARKQARNVGEEIVNKASEKGVHGTFTPVRPFLQAAGGVFEQSQQEVER